MRRFIGEKWEAAVETSYDHWATACLPEADVNLVSASELALPLRGAKGT